MKRLLTAAMVLSLVGGSAAMAQPYHNDRHDSRNERHDDRNDRYGNDRYDRHDNGQHRGQYKKWARGQRLPSEYRTRGHYVDYRRHHLRAPPRGYQWVQVNNDYMMVALATGLIASIIIANN
jgi:Ni/Co efflux regulator RcnB